MLNSNDNKIKKYCRINEKDIGPFLTDVFLDYKIVKTNEKNECDLFLPKGENENKMLSFSKNTTISTIDNINQINKKNLLWLNLSEKYGKKIAGQIIPPTFNILQKQQLREFAVDYLFNRGTYILKNEQESARGILVSNDLKKITQHIFDKKNLGYPVTVIQKIIKSYLIHNRVFKIRMFLLIKGDKNTNMKHFYLHKLGSIFYASDPYDKNNLNNNNIIANGYWYNLIHQTDYVGFINDKPKTLNDLLKYFDNQGINSKKIMNKIKGLLKMIFKSVENKIYKNQKNDQFCLLGFDIMIDENLKPWIIEFNKGPSTNNYNDSNVYYAKKKVWGDIYKLLENKNNDFYEIYTS